MRLMHLMCLSVIAVSACASVADSYTPIVDLKNEDVAKYRADLAECRQYARQVDPASEAVAGGLVAAAAGAAIGAAIGAAYGDAGQGAAAGAATGGATGTATGLAAGAYGQAQVIQRCLTGRGYQVLR